MTTFPRATEADPGLSSEAARARLAADGPNVLPAVPQPPAWHQLGRQMVHFFAVMLWVAGGLAFVAGMPALGVAIFVVVVVNGAFAFVQEHRAERAASRLRDLLPRRARVVRDGELRDVDAAELVVGDLVVLEAGDRVSADLHARSARSLSVDVSLLTGESVPVAVDVGEALYAGTFVVEGEGRAVVTATGLSTTLAGIALLTRAGHRPRTPLARELDRVVRVIAVIALAVGIGFFGLALLLGTDPSDGFLFAIGVTVALVPEGLLPTVTLSLAVGAQRMANRRALVRRLEAVETLGSTTFICTDKTGTLTRNEMTVVDVWTPDGAETRLARVAARCTSTRADPMEAALHEYAARCGIDLDADVAEHPDRLRFPFDPRRRLMSVVVAEEVFVKGAPDAVFPRCVLPPGARHAVEEMAGRGLRVLGVASRAAPASEAIGSPEEAERGLVLVGLVGLEDPPREGAQEALAACRRAGIRVAMITGDHPATAAAIGREVGLVRGEERVVVGRDLPPDDEMLGALVDYDGIVLARVTPEDKLRIARCLRTRGHVVAMTGDGVNDGPALQEADIGVAMGGVGTDVAREAADLVLLDDDFATIVDAVEQGRATFSNIRRFLTYHLTDNVAELTPFAVWALSGGRIPLALGVLQVLCLDIGTDLLPAVALGAELPGRHVLDGPPARGHLVDRSLLIRVFGVLGPVEAVVEMGAFLGTFLALGWRPGEPFPGGSALEMASGAAFTAVVVGQMANAFACRSTTRPPWRLPTRNRLLIGAVLVELLLLVCFLYVEPLASLLRHAPPTASGAAIAALAAPLLLIADALHKRRRSRR
ncbi:MAG: cation-transporting P-type ATPase [Acidimicrobiia bacterium]